MLTASAIREAELANVARILLGYASVIGAAGQRALARRLVSRAVLLLEHRGVLYRERS